MNLQKFVRSLNINKYFFFCQNLLRAVLDPVGTHSNLGNRSVFNPPNVDTKHIEVFKNMILSDLDSMKIKKARDPAYIKKGISSLESKKKLVVMNKSFL